MAEEEINEKPRCEWEGRHRGTHEEEGPKILSPILAFHYALLGGSGFF